MLDCNIVHVHFSWQNSYLMFKGTNCNPVLPFYQSSDSVSELILQRLSYLRSWQKKRKSRFHSGEAYKNLLIHWCGFYITITAMNVQNGNMFTMDSRCTCKCYPCYNTLYKYYPSYTCVIFPNLFEDRHFPLFCNLLHSFFFQAFTDMKSGLLRMLQVHQFQVYNSDN